MSLSHVGGPNLLPLHITHDCLISGRKTHVNYHFGSREAKGILGG